MRKCSSCLTHLDEKETMLLCNKCVHYKEKECIRCSSAARKCTTCLKHICVQHTFECAHCRRTDTILSRFDFCQLCFIKHKEPCLCCNGSKCSKWLINCSECCKLGHSFIKVRKIKPNECVAYPVSVCCNCILTLQNDIHNIYAMTTEHTKMHPLCRPCKKRYCPCKDNPTTNSKIQNPFLTNEGRKNACIGCHQQQYHLLDNKTKLCCDCVWMHNQASGMKTLLYFLSPLCLDVCMIIHGYCQFQI